MRWRVAVLDDSLSPVGELGLVSSIQVSKDASGNLLESCSVLYEGDAVPDGTWCRIEARGEQRHVLGTYRMSYDGTDMSHGRTVRRLVGESVLAPCAAISVAAGTTMPAGRDVGQWSVGMLSACPGTVSSIGEAVLSAPIVFDGTGTALDAVWQVLDAAGWRIRLTGDGDAVVEPLPTDPHVMRSGDMHGIADGVSFKSGEASWSRRPDDAWALLDAVELHVGGDSIGGRLMSQSVTAGACLQADEAMGEGRASS